MERVLGLVVVGAATAITAFFAADNVNAARQDRQKNVNQDEPVEETEEILHDLVLIEKAVFSVKLFSRRAPALMGEMAGAKAEHWAFIARGICGNKKTYYVVCEYAGEDSQFGSNLANSSVSRLVVVGAATAITTFLAADNINAARQDRQKNVNQDEPVEETEEILHDLVLIEKAVFSVKLFSRRAPALMGEMAGAKAEHWAFIARGICGNKKTYYVVCEYAGEDSQFGSNLANSSVSSEGNVAVRVFDSLKGAALAIVRNKEISQVRMKLLPGGQDGPIVLENVNGDVIDSDAIPWDEMMPQTYFEVLQKANHTRTARESYGWRTNNCHHYVKELFDTVETATLTLQRDVDRKGNYTFTHKALWVSEDGGNGRHCCFVAAGSSQYGDTTYFISQLVRKGYRHYNVELSVKLVFGDLKQAALECLVTNKDIKGVWCGKPRSSREEVNRVGGQGMILNNQESEASPLWCRWGNLESEMSIGELFKIVKVFDPQSGTGRDLLDNTRVGGSRQFEYFYDLWDTCVYGQIYSTSIAIDLLNHVVEHSMERVLGLVVVGAATAITAFFAADNVNAARQDRQKNVNQDEPVEATEEILHDLVLIEKAVFSVKLFSRRAPALMGEMAGAKAEHWAFIARGICGNKKTYYVVCEYAGEDSQFGSNLANSSVSSEGNVAVRVFDSLKGAALAIVRNKEISQVRMKLLPGGQDGPIVLENVNGDVIDSDAIPWDEMMPQTYFEVLQKANHTRTARESYGWRTNNCHHYVKELFDTVETATLTLQRDVDRKGNYTFTHKALWVSEDGGNGRHCCFVAAGSSQYGDTTYFIAQLVRKGYRHYNVELSVKLVFGDLKQAALECLVTNKDIKGVWCGKPRSGREEVNRVGGQGMILNNQESEASPLWCRWGNLESEMSTGELFKIVKVFDPQSSTGRDLLDNTRVGGNRQFEYFYDLWDTCVYGQI
eukprot:sb/3461730/